MRILVPADMGERKDWRVPACPPRRRHDPFALQYCRCRRRRGLAFSVVARSRADCCNQRNNRKDLCENQHCCMSWRKEEKEHQAGRTTLRRHGRGSRGSIFKCERAGYRVL